MKFSVLILAILLAHYNCFSQDWDSLGIDNSPLLNSAESNFLNEKLTNRRGYFDFSNKKIIFATGSSGTTIENKIEHFNDWERSESDSFYVPVQLQILNEPEKTATGGYDAIVVTWSKVVASEKTKQKLIRKLKRTQN